VGEVLVRGTGVGPGSVTGRVVVADTAAEASRRIREGDVLVLAEGASDFVPLVSHVAAVISEDGGASSPAVAIGVARGIPVLVGARGATQLLRDGDVVTIDAGRGVCFRRRSAGL